MSSAPRSDTVDLRNVYNDLATALGSAHHQATLADGSPDQLAAVNQAVQQLWSLTGQRLGAGLERADLGDLPPVIEPDPQALLTSRWSQVLLDVPHEDAAPPSRLLASRLSASRGKDERTFSQSCPVCRGRTPHTDGGECQSCWKKGR